MLDNMSISMRQVRADLYSAILFGFAVSELVYKVNMAGKIVIDKIRGIDIRTIWDGFVYDDYGDVIEIVQTIWGVASIDQSGSPPTNASSTVEIQCMETCTVEVTLKAFMILFSPKAKSYESSWSISRNTELPPWPVSKVKKGMLKRCKPTWMKSWKAEQT